ncbi:outer membrane protein [Legionella taurinensis]|uniref:outer membrane protein n=1 Tax=Legionella taurinensis TaxID=70611 RepID=UPI000E046589|nr:outer membrane beta-barrel protein [Legionella taurinensis]STY25420.1 Lipid A 3-O-deacylase (PagL) [Legionella taurinensis]
MSRMLKANLALVSLLWTAAAPAAVYFNLGAGGAFSSTSNRFTGNSTTVLYGPTAIGTSLFSLPDVNWRNEFKNGFDLNAALGYRLNDTWRADVEFLYQNLKHHSQGNYDWQEQNPITGAIYARQANNPISDKSKRAHVYSLLTNIAYDLTPNGQWTPFLNGGVGVAWLQSGRVKTNNIINIDDPATPLVETAPATQTSPSLYGTAFAWQFKAGAAYAVNDKTTAILQYRLLGTSSFKASGSVITSNPGTPGQASFYIAEHDIKGLLTQAIEFTLRLNV